MTLSVFHAPDGQDALLRRAFRDNPQGFYIDLAAGDPEGSSATRLLYEHGWHGINVVADAADEARLAAARPRDLCLTGRGELGFAGVCRDYAEGRDVHLLILGAGNPAAELDGPGASRPWAIVTPAGAPISRYREAWFDGRNHVFIAEERWDALYRSFCAGAADEMLDAATLLKRLRATEAALARAEDAGESLKQAWRAALGGATRAAERAGRLAGQERIRTILAEQRAEAAEALVQTQKTWLEAVRTSRSWRYTAPLRRAADAFRRTLSPPPEIGPNTPRLEQPDGGADRPTIFVECTHTYGSPVNTGIQRVVRNVVRHLDTVAASHGYAVSPVRLVDKRFVGADGKTVISDKQRARAAGEIAQEANGPRLELDLRESTEGDILLLLDSAWHTPIWPAVDRFKARGGRVIGVVYDLIPISHPRGYDYEFIAEFTAWLHNQLRYADALIGISRSVARQLDTYLRRQETPRDIAISHFYLGADLDFMQETDKVRWRVREIFETTAHVFLMVGSIEPRKNHAFVLDAFERFWKAGGQACLVIIGRQGWRTDDFLDRVEDHDEFDRQLHLLRDVNDSELDFAYRNASALVFASQVEGFGLPIVEAFERGLPVLCSDIPVFREIAENRAVFFPLDDVRSLAASLAEFCRTRAASRRTERDPQKWLTWEESTEQLVTAMTECMQARSETPATDSDVLSCPDSEVPHL